MHTAKELAPEEDQGIVFSVTKAPKYANIDYLDFYGEKLDKVFAGFPETDLRFVLNGINGPQNGIAGMLLKPWDERERSSIKLKPLVQAQLSKIEGVNAFAFNLPPLPGGPGGLPVQMVINSTDGYQSVYEQMAEAEGRRAQERTVHRLRQRSRLQPAGGAGQDRPLEGERSRHHHGEHRQYAGDAARRQLRQPVQSRGTIVSGDSAGAARAAAVAARRSADITCRPTTGQQVPLSTVVSIETGTDPNALTHYNQLNSATFQAVPMPGVTVGQAVDFLEGQAKQLPAGFSHDYLSDSRQYVQEGNQLAITFGFALIIIFLVLAAQFESLRDPLVIMISVPMAIVGALIPLFFGVATMNIYTQVGSAHVGRPDQQARHSDGRVRQRTAAQ